MSTRQLPPGIDEETIRETMRLGHENFEYLDTRREEFLTSHPDEWVVVDGGRAAFGPTLDAALAEARKRGFNLYVAAVEHLQLERPTILL